MLRATTSHFLVFHRNWAKKSQAIMDRGRKAMPVQNKACMERYIQKCQERHKQKVSHVFFMTVINSYLTLVSNLTRQSISQLRDMKCSIDNKCPRAATHLKTKAKKNALMEDRFAQIRTENRLLLEKMSHIMRVSPVWTCQYLSTQHPYAHNIPCSLFRQKEV